MAFLEQIVFCSVFVLLAHSQALPCYIMQEQDSSSGRYRWAIPVPDPCQCTQIQLGGKNTQTPCRPFNVTYYDTFMLSNIPEEIQQWLKCSDITCSTKDFYTSTGVTSNCTNDVNVTYGTICQLSCNYGYIQATSLASCQSGGNRIGVWSAATLRCKPVTCPAPASAPDHGYNKCGHRGNTKTNPSSPQPFDTTCNVTCDGGYTLFGSANFTCLVDGNWDKSASECKDVTDPVVDCPYYDRYVFTGHLRSLIVVPWSDWEPVWAMDAGHRIEATLQSINSVPIHGSKPTTLDPGEYFLVYTATDDSGNSGSCNMTVIASEIKCDGSPEPSNGHVIKEAGSGTCTGGAFRGSICKFGCDTGYILSTGGDSTTRTCLLRCYTNRLNICYKYFSNWYPSKAPSCLAISSCREYIEARQSHGSGDYLIFPRCKGNSLSPITVYCDQESNGGGWMRLFYKSGQKRCFNRDDFDWSGELVSCLGLDNNGEVSFAVSDDVDTLSTDNSWILNGCSWLADKDEPDDVIARLANCKTPTGHKWSGGYREGHVHITGVFSTQGDWSNMTDGCGQYIHVGKNTSFRIGGSESNRGEFVNIDSTCDVQNALTSLWNDDEIRVMWIKT